MLVVTGAAGFIASQLAAALHGESLVLVDDFSAEKKAKNHTALEGLRIPREQFADWLVEHADEVELVFHLGARTDTTEFNFRVLDGLNTAYSKTLWEICSVKNIPLIYASSAATYGLGEQGFDDDPSRMASLKPLNPYGLSKQLFDMHVMQSSVSPSFWAGLKFFNVYGSHEQHKGRMASVVFHAYHQIKNTGALRLFQSHHPDFNDGDQLRDFIYVDDVVAVCCFLLQQFREGKTIRGIYNLGTGKARSFNDLAKAVFDSMQKPVNIQYIPTPEDIRDKYQYYTEAKMDRLRAMGYHQPFTSLETGISLYINYLQQHG